MRAVTANNMNNAGFEVSKRTLLTRNITVKEVILMNLLSSMMVRDNEMKKTSVENKRINMNQDHGFHIYKTLEFSRDNSSKSSHNLQMEMICSRLVY